MTTLIIINHHNVTNLGLCNKEVILVTYKQVFWLYFTAIEHKTLYSLGVPHSIPQCTCNATTTTTTTLKNKPARSLLLSRNKDPAWVSSQQPTRVWASSPKLSWYIFTTHHQHGWLDFCCLIGSNQSHGVERVSYLFYHAYGVYIASDQPFWFDTTYLSVKYSINTYVRYLNYALSVIAKMPNYELTGNHTLSLPLL